MLVEARVRIGLESRRHRSQNRLPRQRVAECNTAFADVVSGPFGYVRAGMSDCAVLTIDNGDLPVCVIRVIRNELRQRLAGGAALREQIDRKIVVARKRKAKRQSDTGVGA